MSEAGATDRMQSVRKQMAEACREVDRPPDGVCLIAVSKTFPTEAIAPVIAAGQRHFGENRVQEAQQKWPGLKAQHTDVTLHLLGPLQSNKAKDAVGLFDVIHSVDRRKIASALAREMAEQGRTLELFVQVNTGEEPQKAGVAPLEVPDFLAFCRQECGLEIAGLMCIPPVDEAPAVHFALLRKLADENGDEGRPLALSMGMSADYDVAVQFGATHIRVGSAIFGPRG